MRLMSGIDTAMPDVKGGWSYHANWNQNDVHWEDDFRQIAGCGFDLVRWGMPWSLAEPERGVYRWDLIDPKVELATKLGVEIFFPVMHFNMPRWIAGPGEVHSALSPRLPDALAEWTHQVLLRYHFRLVIPVVEVQMDAFQRARLGNWQPHLKNRKSYQAVYQNISNAFRTSAKVAKEHGATVFCSEPAHAVSTVVELRDVIDVAGIDLYPHMHRRWGITGYLRNWWRQTGLPLCISEFGTPETYDPRTRIDDYSRFITAGIDHNRVEQARQLRRALQQAKKDGIPIPFGGWYPGTGNIGWGDSLTKERTGLDCDRAGIVDLARQPDGSLRRVLCHALVKEVLGLRDLEQTAIPAEMLPAEYAASPAEPETSEAAIPAPPVTEPAVQ